MDNWTVFSRYKFQFTRPRGARHLWGRTPAPAQKFQFTRPRGARRHGDIVVCDADAVSIHAPTGGATRERARAGPDRCFNSRAHGGRDGRGADVQIPDREFQFTRPRGARHDAVVLGRARAVSIHAPTGGATATAKDFNETSQFQFTRPRGARLRADSRGDPREVSIHAPTGGATSASGPDGFVVAFQFTRPRGARPRKTEMKISYISFNSRAHGGRDLVGASAASIKTKFQFTRPRGARRARRTTSTTAIRFNSRAHGGRDNRQARE